MAPEIEAGIAAIQDYEQRNDEQGRRPSRSWVIEEIVYGWLRDHRRGVKIEYLNKKAGHLL